MQPQTATPRTVLIRDLLLFQAKLIIDGLKDLLLVKLALVVAVIDLLFGGRRRGRLFYGLMRGGEEFDLWLNLYGPAAAAERSSDGLVARSGVPNADGVAARMESLLVVLYRAVRNRITGGRRAPRTAPPVR